MRGCIGSLISCSIKILTTAFISTLQFLCGHAVMRWDLVIIAFLPPLAVHGERHLALSRDRTQNKQGVLLDPSRWHWLRPGALRLGLHRSFRPRGRLLPPRPSLAFSGFPQ